MKKLLITPIHVIPKFILNQSIKERIPISNPIVL